MRILILFFITVFNVKLFGQRNQPVIYNNRYQFGLSESRIEVLENKDTVFITKADYRNTNNYNIEEVEKMYKGTPIFQNAWFTNSIIYVDGLATKGNIAYNLLNKDIQFSAKDINNATVVKPDSFMLAGHHFIHLAKKVKMAHNHYYELIFKNNKLGIYRAYNCTYRPKVEGQKTGYHISTDDFEGSFMKTTSIFLLEKDELVELKKNSSLFKIFGDKKNEMEKYAKSKDLNEKKERDLIEIVKYYSSIN